ncbi:MAG: DUF362 domain-containing protein [Alistipes sp.]|nr:DUF362 domain-containing protein [Alistipes sp.]
MNKIALTATILSIILSAGACKASKKAESGQTTVPVVYMTREISPEAIVKMYRLLGREAHGRVAIKLSMGEPGGDNYLKPELIGDFVRLVEGTFIDANTAYGGQRASTQAHLRTARDHGFTAVAPVDILDAEGEIDLPVAGGTRITRDIVGKNFLDYDFTVILSHFKGHAMGGFGGAVKNMSIGIASANGKRLIHSGGTSTTSWGNPTQEEFLETMAEAAKAIADHCGDNIIYISVMNNLSVDCDCDSAPADPQMGDIGILASLDPVALDQACIDRVYASEDHGKIHLIERMESRKGTHTLIHAEKIGLGSRQYQLVIID